MTRDKEEDMIVAKQWLGYATVDLERAINCSGSDVPGDIRNRDLFYRDAIRSLEEACALLGMEVILPALEEKL
jgi:hypothetical protein